MRKPIVSLMGSLMLIALGCGGPSQDAKEAVADSAAPMPESSAPASSSDIAPVDSAPPVASATPAAPMTSPTTLTGNLLGKPFAPQSAFAMAGAKPGTVLVEILDQPVSCGALPQTPGAQKIGLLLPWKEGSTDVKTLKGGKDPEAYIMVVNAKKKFDLKDFKATGKVDVLKAPKKGSEIGRIKLDTKQGKDTLVGEIDVKICGDLP